MDPVSVQDILAGIVATLSVMILLDTLEVA